MTAKEQVWYVVPEYNDDGELIKRVTAKNATEALRKVVGFHPRRLRKYAEGFYGVESKYDQASESRYRAWVVFTKEGIVKYHGEKEALAQFRDVGVMDFDAWKTEELWCAVELEEQRRSGPDNEELYQKWEKAMKLWESTRPKTVEEIQ